MELPLSSGVEICWQDVISTSVFLINQSSNLQGAGPTNLARPLFETAKELMIILQLQHNTPVNYVYS
jgi:hypothetical protein